MLRAINTKLLIAILAALTAISAVLFKIERHESERAAAARQQQAEQEQMRRDDEEYRKQVEAARKKSHTFAGNESKTWQKYY